MEYKTLAHPSHHFNIQDALLTQLYQEGWKPINYHLVEINRTLYRVIQLARSTNDGTHGDEQTYY